MIKNDSYLLNHPVDVSEEFGKIENTYFTGHKVEEFNPNTMSGKIQWKRLIKKPRMSFNQVETPFEETEPWEFPPDYAKNPVLPFSISFVSPRTIRIRMSTHHVMNMGDKNTLMLASEQIPEDKTWEVRELEGKVVYENEAGSLTINLDPFRLEFRDVNNRIITQTKHMDDSRTLSKFHPVPFSFVRKAEDLSRHLAASFSLSPDEAIFGCGESFTRLNKRGQKVVLWTIDPHSAQSKRMYKPIPFFMSNKGYGMFVHTSTPSTFDFGNTSDEASTLFLGDDELDLFVFLGNPKEILEEYTNLTGKSPVPPLWSFGLWMSRITYKSEAEVRDVAEKLRENRIPCDVIHIDTGWFEEDWRCNYEFSKSRFEDPERMIKDLKEMGFNISLWQLPYFTPNNKLFMEAIEKGYVILDGKDNLPTEDAILDFSNPEAVEWYQGLLSKLFDMGVAAIKADFGEAAPLKGRYKSGKSGFVEHNLYPLRYNKAVHDITKEKTGGSIIWGRSAWAGSQRYPIHWGGDAENTDIGMAASLRAGLSLGLCGFSFWSHDMGGFVYKSPEELYRRWAPFGFLSSHSRCHGAPPKEPWAYSDEFMEDFRRAAELKYELMPYIYSQSVLCSKKGFPMIRPLFFEFPEDRTSWFIEDEYLFGEDLLVAPLMEEGTNKREAYLPPGIWIDYQTHRVYQGGGWQEIAAGQIPIIILAREGSVIPHIPLAQHTGEMRWDEIKLRVFHAGSTKAQGYLMPPDSQGPGRISLDIREGNPVLGDELKKMDINWTVESIKGK